MVITGENITWILTILSAVFGGTSFYTLLLYRKQQKRFKTAEAFGQEVTALEATITTLQKQVEFHEQRLNATQQQLMERDAQYTQLMKEKHVLESKNYKNKTAINSAFSCEFCEDTKDCPVLKQRTKHETEYLQSLENVHNSGK